MPRAALRSSRAGLAAGFLSPLLFALASTCAAEAKPRQEPKAAGVEAKGLVEEVSPPPEKDAPYPNYFIAAYVKDLVGEDGKPIGEGDGVLRILAMCRRKILPSAALKRGDSLKVRLKPWETVDIRMKQVQRGTLRTVMLEIDKKHYLAEIPDAPALSEEDLKRVGEESN